MSASVTTGRLASGGRAVMIALGCCVIALGGWVMLGWHLHRPAWVQLLPHLTPMQYNTALAFALSVLVSVGFALYVSIFRDITARKETEAKRSRQAEKLRQTNEELSLRERAMHSLLEDLEAAKEQLQRQTNEARAANARLKELAVAKDEFVAKVSHELRTPLTSIKEGLSLLLDEALGAVSSEQRDFLQTIDGDIDRLAELINNMLDISKIEAGRMRLSRRRLAMRDVVEAVIKSAHPILGRRTIRTELAETPSVFADRNRMIQVLMNLLSNAIKFTKDDGAITFRLVPQEGAVRLAVCDDGPGIAKADLPKLFQKFSQVGPQAIGRPHGTGLGLVVCKELVELHGGIIDVASQPGHGTTFAVRLPAYTDALALRESVQELSALAGDGEGTGLVALDMRALLSADPAEQRSELERLAEEVRHHLHRGDIVLPLDPPWVVIVANAPAGGLDAIIRRLATTLRQSPSIRFHTGMGDGGQDDGVQMFVRAAGAPLNGAEDAAATLKDS